MAGQIAVRLIAFQRVSNGRHGASKLGLRIAPTRSSADDHQAARSSGHNMLRRLRRMGSALRTLFAKPIVYDTG